MKVDVIEKEGLKREMTVEIPAEIVDAAYAKIYNQLKKNAKLDGFRPGKTPLSVIKQKFKPEATAEVVDELIKEYYGEAIAEAKLEPVGTPILSNVDIDEGKPMSFTLGIEIMPQIDTVRVENLKLTKVEGTVEDKQVDDLLTQIQKEQATLRAVDRAATEADIVFVDLKPISGAVEALGNTPLDNQEIVMDGENTVKEFKDGLLGAKRDDTREITLKYPEDFQDKKYAGQAVTFETTVKEVKERILPELNDDFAKQTTMAETLLELKLKIRKNLEKEKESEVARTRKKELVDQMVELNSFDVPDTMVDSYLNGVVKEHQQHNPKANEKDIREKYRQTGINTVRWYLIYHRLAVQEKIEVSSEDTEKWIKNFADTYHMDTGKAKEILAKTGRADDIKDGLLEEKVLDFLADKAGK
ncbi:MAG: trigger factor [Candidatus Zixiibacteriota bacterium]